MSTLLTVLCILGGILLLGVVLILVICHEFDNIHKELEELTDLEKENDDDRN